MVGWSLLKGKDLHVGTSLFCLVLIRSAGGEERATNGNHTEKGEGRGRGEEENRKERPRDGEVLRTAEVVRTE